MYQVICSYRDGYSVVVTSTTIRDSAFDKLYLWAKEHMRLKDGSNDGEIEKYKFESEFVTLRIVKKKPEKINDLIKFIESKM